jgi:sugar phosphate isomerase/epimerase
MHQALDRRQFLLATAEAAAITAAGVVLPRTSWGLQPAPALAKPTSFTLGFSLYGMNGLPLDEALRRAAEIGFTDVEPALMPGFSGDPTQLPKMRRAELRKLVESLDLNVPALMENLRPCVDDGPHAENLRRLALAAELGHDLSPGRNVVVETVLGGKPSDWPGIRSQMVDRLGQWSDAAKQHDFVLAVKPHVSNALHTPDDCRKLVDELGSEHLRAAFDYSHYEAQGLDLAASLETLIGRTVFIHVKDSRQTVGKKEFLLPGEGRTDYTAYFRLLRKHGYTGSVTVEVSSMIHSKPGYDPIAAAKKSFAALKQAFDASAA